MIKNQSFAALSFKLLMYHHQFSWLYFHPVSAPSYTHITYRLRSLTVVSADVHMVIGYRWSRWQSQWVSKNIMTWVPMATKKYSKRKVQSWRVLLVPQSTGWNFEFEGWGPGFNGSQPRYVFPKTKNWIS